MPIYEFYCADCNALFNFFSSVVDTEKRPDCPRCGRERLERRPATFATLKHGNREDGGDSLDALDDAGLERAMEGMATELESVGDSDDPKQFARVLRRMGSSSGIEMGPKMEEFLGRLESGADPDDLEAEMGSMDSGSDDEDNFDDYFRFKKKIALLGKRRPRLDADLYFL